MQPINLTAVISGKRYNTQTATLLCDDAYWDGHNFERYGRNMFLYRTRLGNYFALIRSMWAGENNYIVPWDRATSVEFFEECLGQGNTYVGFSEAFPGIVIQDA